jgi:predicted  nucleic acid-binding Zn-ribbon protein
MSSPKSFWRRPEGVTGTLFLLGILAGAGFLLYLWLPVLLDLAKNTLYLAAMLAALGAVLFVVLDPKTRNLVWYMYKSVMRWITGIFLQIDPIGILKTYIGDLEKSLAKLSKQIGALRGQMRQLKQTMDGNNAEIRKNLTLAEQAKSKKDEKNTTISARKAARLQEANEKYDVLYKKMDVLYRILTKMYENSEIVLDDTKDQVQVKEQEYHAIRTSHSAIQSAMSILKGSPDQRAMFDQALESMAEEVSAKVGEMERFMDTSKNLLDSIDLQSGVFADEGLQMLENWEKQGVLSLDPAASKKTEKPLDLNAPKPELLKEEDQDYNRLFD